MNVIIASNNENKIKEYKKILEPMGYTVMSQKQAGINLEVDETGTTFEENAKLKAEAVYNFKKTAVLADDSGTEVDFLNGEPGIYSARYMGLKTEKERRMAVLSKLKDVKEENRTARYICCICFIQEDGKVNVVKGIWEGTITNEEIGSNGFGYDCIFKPNGETKTVAQMSEQEKNSKSHRAIAVNKLKAILQ